MLYNLARKGEIDPVNIDVVDVADKFLRELEKAKKLDLRISGRVLLYAAILVRMKSDIITTEAIGIQEEESEDDYEGDFPEPTYIEYDYPEDEFESYIAQDFIEEEILDESILEDELISALIDAGRKRVRRYTTLEDLIKELESAEKVRKARRKRRVRRPEAQIDPLEVPHDEDLEESIERLKTVIEEMMKNRDIVKLGEIAGFDLVSKYISVLHLAFRRVFEIHQERIFETDIEIRRLNNEGQD
ncbi:segregation/condensation protein A [Geoglobus acetivorans]|uniref:Segregation and condensation protein A n=1 Tax=Geoglobus acetivorans TaxID=565033 RepID=A0A0A7GHW0_GEOAI|nr:Segregation and condensation protein A [Geoglobus acetivorans]